jgi:hypothetical protein
MMTQSAGNSQLARAYEYLGEPIRDPSFYQPTPAERKRDAEREERENRRGDWIQLLARSLIVVIVGIFITAWIVIPPFLPHEQKDPNPITASKLDQIDGAISQLQELRDKIDPPEEPDPENEYGDGPNHFQ